MSTEIEKQVRVRGNAWISSAEVAEGEDIFWYDGGAGSVEVENTDEDELAVHIFATDEDSADASFYMSYHEAMRLMASLGRAVLR